MRRNTLRGLVLRDEKDERRKIGRNGNGEMSEFRLNFMKEIQKEREKKM